jgi:membrane fusion protein (multidrug efflux system)
MSKQMTKMLIVTGIVFGVIFGWYGVKKYMMFYFMSHYEMPPVTISSSIATPKTWQSFLSSVGTLTAVNGVDISAEVPGIVKEIRFTSGQFVKKGDILVLLDASVEEAQLKDNSAKLKLMQINYNRNQTLLKKNATSQSVIDTSYSDLKSAEASVEMTEAKISQKTIVAPFDGRLGIRQIDIGAFVPTGNAMVTLQSLDPLLVRFNIPEQYVSELYPSQMVELSVNIGGGKFVQGTITAINSKVDQTTRNVLVEATIPNKEFQLYPGMFALVKIYTKQQKNVITLPQTSISYSLHGDSVFVIKSDAKDKQGKPVLHAYRQYVQVGERRGDEVSIVKGIEANTQVVTSGQLKLQNGTHVIINNSVVTD